MKKRPNSTIIRVLFIISIFVILMVILITVWSHKFVNYQTIVHDSRNITLNPDGTSTLLDTIHNFSITFPPTWSNEFVGGNLVLRLKPLATDDNDVYLTVRTFTSSYASQEDFLANITKASVETAFANQSNLQLISVKELSLDEYTVLEIHYVDSSRKKTHEIVFFNFLASNNMLFSISYIAPPEEFEKYYDDAINIMYSFEVQN